MMWPSFFTKKSREGFHASHVPAGFEVNPTDEQSLISFQRRLEKGEGPYFIDGNETVQKELTSPLTVYRLR